MDCSEEVQLTHRKESQIGGVASSAPFTISRSPPGDLPDGTESMPEFDEKTYPFAVVLRFRVLQIVCGISSMVMGVVAFIEERDKFNLSLGIPTGGVTVLAAAASIHTSRGFDGYRASSCSSSWSRLRFLGPNIKIAVPLCILWSCACLLQTALVAICIQSLFPRISDSLNISFQPLERSPTTDEETTKSITDENDLIALAAIQMFLSSLALLTVVVLLRIDCMFDPD